MDWNAKAAWIYKDSTPDPVKAAAHGITVVYIDPRSGNAAAVRDALRAHGITAGAYIATSWKPATTPIEFAAYAHQLLQTVVPRGTRETPPAMLDLEGVSASWTIQTVRAYRSHQPARPTAYTNAPFQGGFVPVAALQAAGMHVYVQLYYGDTLPDGRLRPADPAAALLEVVRQGMPGPMVHPFYDGKALPADARDGCVFTLERIP